jgi:hypothetical protein
MAAKNAGQLAWRCFGDFSESLASKERVVYCKEAMKAATDATVDRKLMALKFRRWQEGYSLEQEHPRRRAPSC